MRSFAYTHQQSSGFAIYWGNVRDRTRLNLQHVDEFYGVHCLSSPIHRTVLEQARIPCGPRYNFARSQFDFGLLRYLLRRQA